MADAAHRLQRLVVGDTRRGLLPGLLAVVAGVAACTAAIFGLREIAPVLSLGVRGRSAA